MGDEWQEAQLTDLYDISSGLSKPAQDFGAGSPFLSFKDVFNNIFVPDELTHLVKSSDKEQEKCSVMRGDVFLTRTSETMHELGMSSVALKSYDNATFNGFTKRLRPKEGGTLIPEFVGYYLRSPQFRSEMLKFSTMSTRASLNNEMIGQLKISYPCVSKQKKIGQTLKGLDDKIELNRRMSRTLEAMARAVFKAWFVDFEPVKAKAAGATSFRGIPQPIFDQLTDRFTDSELGLVPEGWDIAPLDEIAEFLNGVALQKYPASPSEDSLPVIKIAELRNGVSVKSGRASPGLPSKYIVNDGDFLFSWSGSLLAKFWTEGEGALNQHLFKVTSEIYPMWFVSQWVQYHLEAFQAIAASKATTMGHIQRRHLKEALTVCAPKHVLDNISTVMSPLIEKMIASEIESRTLKLIRDSLLPKLISGEVSPSAAITEGE